MEHSCGIILYRHNDAGDLEFFVGHPGGRAWEHKDYWSLFKGRMEAGENEKDTAVREFEEETGLVLTKDMQDSLWRIDTVQQNPHKIVTAFALCFDSFDAFDVSMCHSNIVEGQSFPEMDRYTWFNFDRLQSSTHKNHIPLYKKIIEYGKNS